MGPGGCCSGCGSWNYWTLIRGEVWTSCSAGCDEDQLEIPGTPPLIAKGSEWSDEHWPEAEADGKEPMELLEEGGVVLPEDGAGRTPDTQEKPQLSFKL